MPQDDDIRTESYLVRLWRHGRHSGWRASLRDVRSGETHHFAHPEALWAFLQAEMAWADAQALARLETTPVPALPSDGGFTFSLWSDGGSAINVQESVTVRVEDGQTMVRQGTGPWEAVDDFSGLFAFGGDFLSYLSAMREVARHEPETRAGITFTRYTFELDWPALAVYMRDQMEDQLRQRGELPLGINLALPRQYVDMTGQGELWVGAQGLPLRQILPLQFPE